MPRRRGTDGGHKKFVKGAKARPKGAPRKWRPGKGQGKGGGDQGPVKEG